MQVTLWVVFGGTVAMAAWVVRERKPAAEHGEWGPTLTAGNITVTLPAGWDAMPGDGADVLLQASERSVDDQSGDDGPVGRTLIVQQFNAPAGESAEQFLTSGGPLKNSMIVDGRSEMSPTDDGIPSKPARIGNVPGVMLETISALTAAPGGPVMRAHEWVACAIEPGNKAVVLRLQRFGGESPEPAAEPDDVLLGRVAEAVHFRRAANAAK